jgi:alpha-amylase
VDNHDTGKEHDKWLVKDYALAYAYILTHEGTPCVFYPHFYAVTQHDVDNPSLKVTAPSDLQQAIRQLIDIRRQYLGGKLAVLLDSDKHLYIARRQGNGEKDGAIIVLNNHDTETLSITINVCPDGFSDWSGQTLVNLTNPQETITVGKDGQAKLSAPKRGYSVWVLKKDCQTS